jgi:hypothetical protein
VFALSLLWQASLVLAIRPLLLKLMPYVPFYVMATVASYTVAAVVIASVAISLPTNATDAPNVTWRDAVNETSGHVWHIFVVFGLVTVPMVVLRLVLLWTPTILPIVDPIYQVYVILRFRLMVERGPCVRPQASEGEAQHGPFCWTGRIGQGDEHLHYG